MADPYPPGSVAPSIVSGREMYITESAWRELWNYKERLRAALKELLDDEWRCTVDWGPRDERQAILERCAALVGPADEVRSDSHD